MRAIIKYFPSVFDCVLDRSDKEADFIQVNLDRRVRQVSMIIQSLFPFPDASEPSDYISRNRQVYFWKCYILSSTF